ncbi:MAG: cyclic nucleotide-binding domain-containing protein [Thermoanaerobaculaceae bacterium]|nr:cyclic nucleotide-binding domain-containing protein [Thermoanaerobaculaceae bacterium]
MVKVRIGGETHRLQELLARFPAGAVIFREGDLGREMFIIQKGHVRISLSVGGREQEVAVLEKGDFFGEMALLDQSPARSATAVAVEAVEALQLRSTDLDLLLRRKPDIAVRMMTKLSERLRETNRRFEELGARTELAALAPAPGGQGIAASAVLAHDASGRLFPLRPDGDTTVGRHDPITGVTPDVDLSGLDPERTVSRRHATIRAEGGALTITETSASTNGTFVNGLRLEPLKPCQLKHGDGVQLALVALRLHVLLGGG